MIRANETGKGPTARIVPAGVIQDLGELRLRLLGSLGHCVVNGWVDGCVISGKLKAHTYTDT